MPPLELETVRLRLVAFTPNSSAAAVQGNAPLAAALRVVVPPDWPPQTLADVQGLFAGQLAANPAEVGWWGWYVIAKPDVVAPDATLVGSTGASPPDALGRSLGGYSILPAFEGQGFATEAARAVFGWVASQPSLRSLEATTFEQHYASRRVLEKLGFQLVGVSPDDADAAESDRQGRGALILYRLPR